MTSGVFQAVDPAFIWVDRAKRQRKALDGIEELAESIRQNGFIHPPVIRRDGELIVGERRWNAVKQLGWTAVPIQWVDDLDEDELQAIEYEENVTRMDLSWQDKVLAVQRYHEHRMKREPNWTATNTAERLGVAETFISQKLLVAEKLISGDTLIAAAPRFSVARNIAWRADTRKRASALDAVAAMVTPQVTPSIPLLHTDFHQWATTYDGPKFNFIHCDFPYGINQHTSDQGSQAFHKYDDDADVYWKLLDRLSRAMPNVVANSAHLMFWFSMDHYYPTLEFLRTMGWTVSPFPLVWMKSDNTGILPDPNRGPRRIYETAFFCARGDRYVKQPVSNAVAWPGKDKTVHPNEKPVGMLKHFFRMFVDEHSRVLDPTCGSGNALKAATALGAHTVLGLEKDFDLFTAAQEAYHDLDI